MSRIYVKASAAGANNGTSWTDAYTSLTSALAAASSGDEVWTSNETYNPGGAAGDYFDVAVKDLTLYGGFVGTETSISQRRLNVNKTVLDGQGINENILITSNSVHPSTLLIDGFKFIDAAGNNDGGAVVLDYALPSFSGSFVTTVRNCAFEGNSSSLRGGAIVSKENSSGEDPDVVIEDCYFYNNYSALDGGCISNYFAGGVTLRRSFFKDNTAGSSGGALFLERRPVAVENCIFSGNTANNSGGAYYNGSAAGAGVLRNCVFYNNEAITGSGGAIYVVNSSGNWDNNIFYGNSAAGADQVYGTFSTGLYLGYSLFDSLTTADVHGVTLGSGNITGDPKFKDAANDDFQLLLSSPCIDAGNGDDAASTDYLGVKRKQIVDIPTGSGTVSYSDIGAYEYWGTQVRRFYVFLDNDYTSTDHVGTQEDPFSYEDFASAMASNPSEGDVFLFRGTRDSNTTGITYFGGNQISLIAWDLDEYGPWRISGSSQFSVNGHLEDAVIQALRIYLVGTSKRVYFRGVVGTGNHASSGTHEQDIIVTTGTSADLTIGLNQTATFSRCAFYGNPIRILNGATLNIDNCITNQADSSSFFENPGTGVLNATSITYGWVPPSLPSLSTKNLTEFALGGGTPSDITSIGGVGYGDGWASGTVYFVNFSEDSTGNNGFYGEDYIGWDEFISLASLSHNYRTFRARGLKTLTADSFGDIHESYIDAWNLSKYGPWKIYGGTGSYTLATGALEIKGGIAYGIYRFSVERLFDRMYFYNTNVETSEGTVQNSTCISTSSNSIKMNGGNGTVSNCVLSNFTITPNGNNGSTYENIITDKATQSNLVTNPGSVGETYTNITYNWTPPVSLPDGTDVNYNNYQLEGSPSAAEYGVQNFPTISYVNIEVSNDTSISNGSDSSSPASYAYMADSLTSLNRALFNVQGHRDLSIETRVLDVGWINENNPYANNKVQDWDNDTYGPWRIRSTDAIIKGINLLNGIIYATQDIALSGYLGEDTSNVYIKDTLLNAANQVKVGSGSKGIIASDLISSGSPISFFKEAPSDVKSGWSYIKDNFYGGTFNSWWDSEFTTGPNKYEIEERPPGSGNYVAVQNGDTRIQLTPNGVDLTGDFILEMCFSLSDNTGGDVSQAIYIVEPTFDTFETVIRYFPDTLQFDNIGSVSVLYQPYRVIYCRLTRVSGVITAEYSIDNTYSWTAVPGSHSYSGPFYMESKGADNHGVGCFNFQVEGVTAGDTSSLPYGEKDNDTDIIDSVIDTPSVTEGIWSYDSIDLQDVSQTDNTWSGTSIAYSGNNQQSLNISWPLWGLAALNNKEAFAFSTIGSNISVPGSGSYSLYPEGLWGVNRTGIGAFYFGVTLDFQGDTSSFIYKDLTSEIVAKATFAGASYTVSINFTPLYDSTATSWFWDFGDGNTSTSRTPTHEYTAEGVFTVSLYINGNTSTTVTKTGYIVVLKSLSFNTYVGPNPWTGGLPKSFDIGITGATRPLDPIPDSPTYDAFSWDLGNGDTVSNVTGLQYSGYLTEGAYTVQATARDVGISGADYTKQTVTASTNVFILSFTLDVNPNAIYVNNPIDYTVNFTGPPPSTIKWEFGDGSTHTKVNPGSSYSVNHTFTSAGFFDATLIFDEGLSSEIVLTYSAGDPNLSELRVAVSDLNPNFTVVPNSGKVPLTGLFTDGSVGSVTGWEWDWGDGFSSTVQTNPVYHTYTGVGSFNPIMTVYDIYGFNASVSKVVTVTEALDFTILPTPGDVSQEISFIPVNDSNIVLWDWSVIYDDPIAGEVVVYSKSTADVLERVYVQEFVAPTAYKVRLDATDDLSTIYTVEKEITLTENIEATANPPSGGAPLTVDFSLSGLDTGSVSKVIWDFTNDGTEDSEELFPSYTYNGVGIYTASVDLLWYLDDAETYLYTITKTVTVNVGTPELIIGASATPSVGHKPLDVSFLGNSSNDVSVWSWGITGIGHLSSSQSFSYEFTNADSYSVIFAVTDIYGQSRSLILNTLVTESVATDDEAVDPADTDSSVVVKEGPGAAIELEDGGVQIYLPAGVSNPRPSGFSRKKGPSLIFD